MILPMLPSKLFPRKASQEVKDDKPPNEQGSDDPPTLQLGKKKRRSDATKEPPTLQLKKKKSPALLEAQASTSDEGQPTTPKSISLMAGFDAKRLPYPKRNTSSMDESFGNGAVTVLYDPEVYHTLGFEVHHNGPQVTRVFEDTWANLAGVKEGWRLVVAKDAKDGKALFWAGNNARLGLKKFVGSPQKATFVFRPERLKLEDFGVSCKNWWQGTLKKHTALHGKNYNLADYLQTTMNLKWADDLGPLQCMHAWCFLHHRPLESKTKLGVTLDVIKVMLQRTPYRYLSDGFELANAFLSLYTHASRKVEAIFALHAMSTWTALHRPTRDVWTPPWKAVESLLQLSAWLDETQMGARLLQFHRSIGKTNLADLALSLRCLELTTRHVKDFKRVQLEHDWKSSEPVPEIQFEATSSSPRPEPSRLRPLPSDHVEHVSDVVSHMSLQIYVKLDEFFDRKVFKGQAEIAPRLTQTQSIRVPDKGIAHNAIQRFNVTFDDEEAIFTTLKAFKRGEVENFKLLRVKNEFKLPVRHPCLLLICVFYPKKGVVRNRLKASNISVEIGLYATSLFFFKSRAEPYAKLSRLKALKECDAVVALTNERALAQGKYLPL